MFVSNNRLSQQVVTLKSICYGIIAGIVNDSPETQILIRLYDFEMANVYRDCYDAEAIYSFRPRRNRMLYFPLVGAKHLGRN